MSYPSRLFLLPFVISLTCLSCGKKEDPQLLEKREQQKVEIARLKGELALLEERLKNLPPDLTVELANTTEQVAQQAADVAKLESQAADLEARKRALQKEFDAYRAKYPTH